MRAWVWILSTHIRRLSVATWACNPKGGKIEPRGSLRLAGQPFRQNQWVPAPVRAPIQRIWWKMILENPERRTSTSTHIHPCTRVLALPCSCFLVPSLLLTEVMYFGVHKLWGGRASFLLLKAHTNFCYFTGKNTKRKRRGKKNQFPS